MGTPKLEARSLCRNLERHGVVKCIMEDEGRQRVTKYVAREFEGQSELSLKFEQEKRKILELSRKYNVGNVGDTSLINGSTGGRRKLTRKATSTASASAGNEDVNNDDDDDNLNSSNPSSAVVAVTEEETTKNRDVSTLVRWLARSFRSLTHSRARGNVNDPMLI